MQIDLYAKQLASIQAQLVLFGLELITLSQAHIHWLELFVWVVPHTEKVIVG